MSMREMLASDQTNQSTMNDESAIRNFVGIGRMCSFPLNTPANFGNTNVSRNTVTEIAMIAMMPG